MHFTRTKIIFLFFTLSFCSALLGQAPISRLYGTYGTETGTSGLILDDSTIFALGTSSAFPSMSSQIYLVKIDKNGDIMWSKFYGGTGVDDAVDMFVDLANDTSIYILSNSFINFSKGYDVKLTKVDKNGNFIWEKNYGTTDWDIPSKMIKTSTDMFAICGKTYGNTNGMIDGMFLLLDNNGDSIVFNNYGGVNDDSFNDLIERSADSIVVVGETFTSTGMQRAWMVEMNIETGTSTNSYFGSVYNRTFNSIEKYKKGNYLIGLTTDSTGITQTDMFIEVMDKNTHNINLVVPVIEANDEICVEAKFFNNEFYFLGLTKTYGLGGWEPVVYRYDTLGGYQYSKTFGTVEDDYATTIIPNKNNSFAFIGTSGFVFGVTDLWVLNLDSAFTNIPTLDSQLDINAIHENEESMPNFSIFPNPFNDFISIKSDEMPFQLILLNEIGEVIFKDFNTRNISLSVIQPGIYFLNLNFKSGSSSTQCVVKIK